MTEAEDAAARAEREKVIKLQKKLKCSDTLRVFGIIVFLVGIFCLIYGGCYYYTWNHIVYYYNQTAIIIGSIMTLIGIIIMIVGSCKHKSIIRELPPAYRGRIFVRTVTLPDNTYVGSNVGGGVTTYATQTMTEPVPQQYYQQTQYGGYPQQQYGYPPQYGFQQQQPGLPQQPGYPQQPTDYPQQYPPPAYEQTATPETTGIGNTPITEYGTKQNIIPQSPYNM